jgi:hypothetical protein
MAIESRPARVFLPEEQAAPIRAALQQAEADWRLVDAEWDVLIGAHRGQWVGVNKGRFVFGASIEAALDAAREAGWEPGATIIRPLIERQLRG